MLRRILIIVLVAVVIIAAFFAIRAFLNRDSGEAEEPEAETTAVVEESGTNTEDGAVEEGDTVDDQTTDASVEDAYPASAEGSGEVAPPEGSGEVAPPEGSGEVAPPEGEAGSPEDPNAGGGVPAEGSGEAAPAEGETDLGDTVAVEPDDAGMGGAEINQPIAFVQPGVPTQHTAANNEWLTQLARCYGTTVADIQAANNYACPDLIHPGYVVNITNPGNVGPITINEMPCFVYHTVQQGETLYSIASIYGIDYQWLARINAIYNYNYVYAGQQLVIPNPVDPVFTTPPAQPYFYSNCWYNYCPGWQYPPVAVPYGY